MLLNYRLKAANHLHPHIIPTWWILFIISMSSHKVQWSQLTSLYTDVKHCGNIWVLFTALIKLGWFYFTALLFSIWLKWKICTLMSPSVPSLLRWCHADMRTVKCGKYHRSPGELKHLSFQWTHNPSLLEHQVIVLQMYVFCISAANRRKLDSWRTKYSREQNALLKPVHICSLVLPVMLTIAPSSWCLRSTTSVILGFFETHVRLGQWCGKKKSESFLATCGEVWESFSLCQIKGHPSKREKQTNSWQHSWDQIQKGVYKVELVILLTRNNMGNIAVTAVNSMRFDQTHFFYTRTAVCNMIMSF